jgi:hypothetical protein
MNPKNIFSIVLLICLIGTAMAQQPSIQKIKIKKEQALYKATLCGIDSGFTSLKKVIADKKLNVTNEKDGIRIYAYEAYIIGDPNDQTSTGVFPGKNAKLSDDLVKALEKDPPVKLAIRKILAYNSFNETIQLNDVIITFIELK